ncbi:MAG TPA: hypothetical protein PLE74_07515 [Candidatus Cloacimonadota bacterium]|nr:hypothetical protein [Candidatus Cloacimonadota bacterium]
MINGSIEKTKCVNDRIYNQETIALLAPVLMLSRKTQDTLHHQTRHDTRGYLHPIDDLGYHSLAG